MFIPSQPNIPRIVITGGPGSGKTKFCNRLKDEPGFERFLFFDELARRLLEEDPTYRGRWAQFHLEIYRRQTAREAEAGERPFITDRGTIDAFAFHPETVSDVHSTIDAEYRRYSGVIQLGSAASLGEEYYKQDDIRQESAADAIFIEKKITEVWKGHPGYLFVEAGADMDEKYARFLSAVKKLAGIEG